MKKLREQYRHVADEDPEMALGTLLILAGILAMGLIVGGVLFGSYAYLWWVWLWKGGVWLATLAVMRGVWWVVARTYRA
jgi:hypothetical protein